MSNIATFYVDSNFGGSSISLTPSLLTIPNLSTYGFNDKISSLKCFDRNYFVTIYSDANYTGSSWRFRAPMIAANLGDYSFQDNISSIKAEWTDDTIEGNAVLYKNSDGTGKGFYVTGPAQFSTMNGTDLGNDSVSSVMLYPNTSVRLYQDINFGGTFDPFVNFDSSIVITQNVPDNDECSSFTVNYNTV